MGMTKQQAQALAHLAHLLQPKWDEAGVMAQLAKINTRNPLDTSLAVIRAAGDQNAQTPGVIATNGPHWNERVTTPEQRLPYPPRRDDECRQHPGQWRDSCNACRVDRHRHESDPETTAPTSRETALTGLRALAREARESRCPHALDPTTCRLCRADAATHTTPAPSPGEVIPPPDSEEERA